MAFAVCTPPQITLESLTMMSSPEELVVLTERADRPVLHGAGSRVDDTTPDGRDGRGCSTNEDRNKK